MFLIITVIILNFHLIFIQCSIPFKSFSSEVSLWVPKTNLQVNIGNGGKKTNLKSQKKNYWAQIIANNSSDVYRAFELNILQCWSAVILITIL